MNQETIQYEISMPLINDEELQRIDNYYNKIVDEFLKKYVKEKDNIIAQRIMMNLRKENQKLKKQISDLECLVESIKLGVTLNQEQEELLDKILFRSDK